MPTTMLDVTDDVDFFSDENLTDPYPMYTRLRDRASATFLTTHDVWFFSRYDVVRAALMDWETYSSADGVGLNDTINAAWANAVICVDPPVHTQMRKLFTDRLGPRHLRPLSETIDARARTLVRDLLERSTIDGVTDLAQDLPINVIMDLVGWPESERDSLLDYAMGSFDCVGPENERMRNALPKLIGSVDYVTRIYDDRGLAEGTFAHDMQAAADSGDISKEAAIGLLLGYVAAAFDTTINLISSGLYLLAQYPEEWAKLRADPSLVPAVINETLRMESPIQCFARVARRTVEFDDGVVIPEGSRILMGYGAANRDERHFPDPDRFDAQRNPVDQLAFSIGIHQCGGQNLARLEARAIFMALAEQVQEIELTGAPVRALNNATRGFESLPLRLR